VIKFADTAADAYARTGNPDALAAAFRAADLIERRPAQPGAPSTQNNPIRNISNARLQLADGVPNGGYSRAINGLARMLAASRP
jgi:hypothetical protein